MLTGQMLYGNMFMTNSLTFRSKANSKWIYLTE